MYLRYEKDSMSSFGKDRKMQGILPYVLHYMSNYKYKKKILGTYHHIVIEHGIQEKHLAEMAYDLLRMLFGQGMITRNYREKNERHCDHNTVFFTLQIIKLFALLFNDIIFKLFEIVTFTKMFNITDTLLKLHKNAMIGATICALHCFKKKQNHNVPSKWF